MMLWACNGLLRGEANPVHLEKNPPTTPKEGCANRKIVNFIVFTHTNSGFWTNYCPRWCLFLNLLRQGSGTWT